MTKFLFPLLALGAGLLASCQPTATTTSTPPPAEATAAPAPGPAPTEASARAAVARHIQTLPNAALYVPDSARVNDNEASWQVLVPRTDWAGRMPNRARFEVDKQTGQVSSQPVK
ncbi:hypothetical protein [Hymenobacter bucti]|uniref:PepSY domain-containing protein n=1 Tax=Hymenobacter bucti TaxID=1844114 RepID=A0ABW4QSX3_9BACT